MAFQTLPTLRDLMRRNRILPEDLRERSVLLEFREPIRKSKTEHFYRIHLTDAMFRAGEENAYAVDQVQPHRAGRQSCMMCRQWMVAVDANHHRCVNPNCVQLDGRPTSDFVTFTGPLRGICQVTTEFEATYQGRVCDVSFVVGHDWVTVGKRKIACPLVDRCLLLLDRRYHPAVLAAVYRAAIIVCEQQELPLK